MILLARHYIICRTVMLHYPFKHHVEYGWHIEFQYFAIQGWRKQGDIVTEHLSGLLNPSAGHTKALGWVLHALHGHRGMFHFHFGL